MKKTTVLVIIIVLILLSIIITVFVKGLPQQTVEAPTTANTASSTGQTVSYSCTSGAINAVFSSDSTSPKVTLALSDKRIFTLPQVVSADGVKYQGQEGTDKDIVFWTKGDSAFITENGKTTYQNCIAGTSNTSGSGTTSFTNAGKLFSFDHPDAFTVSGGDGTYSQNWKQGATTSGMLLAKATLPKSFQPNTNFSEAQFTVGASSDPSAVKSCLIEGNGNPATNTKITINNVSYAKITFSDAGAGNRYDTTSYRVVRDNQCYAIEYTIHSTNIGNYPPEAGIKEFDTAKVENALEEIVHSFKFL